VARRQKSTYERLRDGERLRRWERKELARQLGKEDPGWEVVHEEVAGIDVGNRSHFAAVDPRRSEGPVREFGSWTAALLEMRAWLEQCGVKRVVLQTTGVYWVPLFDILRTRFEVVVVDARGTKSLPGRKSDVQECQWIRKLDIYGLLRECFQPPEEIQAIRTIWRLRERWVTEAGRSIQQMQKALTKMNVQLANAISDIGGKTGMAIIRAIVGGERDPRQLAWLRDSRIQASEEEVAHSLEGNWREDLLFELQQVLAGYDFQQQQIAECDRQAEKYLRGQPAREGAEGKPEQGAGKRPRKPRKNQPGFDLTGELRRVMGVDLTRIDGIKELTAQIIYTEIGPDLSAFPSEAHFASWLGLAPRRDVSGGRVIRQYSAHVANRVANALRMAAESLHHSNSYLGARYRYLKRQLKEPLKAVKAMARYLACLVYRMMTRGEAYVDRGAAHYEQKRHDHDLMALRRKAASLGMQLVPHASLDASLPGGPEMRA
jgi:transposase